MDFSIETAVNVAKLVEDQSFLDCTRSDIGKRFDVRCFFVAESFVCGAGSEPDDAEDLTAGTERQEDADLPVTKLLHPGSFPQILLIRIEQSWRHRPDCEFHADKIAGKPADGFHTKTVIALVEEDDPPGREEFSHQREE